MNQALDTELIHITCPQCKQITSLSFRSLTENNSPICPYCGTAMHVDLHAAEQDAQRKARELDQTIDSLGSTE